LLKGIGGEEEEDKLEEISTTFWVFWKGDFVLKWKNLGWGFG
jgi:hypothetical protein